MEQPTVKQIQKWCYALRSGEYKQARKQLQTRKGYCCLGVACIINIPKRKLKLTESGRLYGDVPDNQPHAPRWLRDVHDVLSETIGEGLIDLNDTPKYRLNFDEIADILEIVFIHARKEEFLPED